MVSMLRFIHFQLKLKETLFLNVQKKLWQGKKLKELFSVVQKAANQKQKNSPVKKMN